ncbi:MAG: diguanylate cyclase [Clostridia bacterium]|nr:diguanylate cyclase [Clostridia bacterium]
MKRNELRNKLSAEQLKQAIDISKIGIWEWSLDTDQVFVSDGVYKTIGILPEQFENTMTFVVGRVIHPESRIYFMKAMALARKEGRVNNDTYRVNHVSKAVCWVRFFSKTVRDAQGNVSKIIGTLMEVTEEVVSQKALMSELEFMKNMVETLPTPIYYKNPKGQYEFCNQAFLNFFGQKRKAVIGRSIEDITSQESVDLIKLADEELLKTQKAQTFEGKVVPSNGTPHTVVFSRAAHFNQRGTVAGIAGVFQDITSQKSIEREMNMLYKAKDAFLSINRDMMMYKSVKEFFQNLHIRLQGIFEKSGYSAVLELDDADMLRIIYSSGYNESDVKKFELPIRDSFFEHSENLTTQRSMLLSEVDMTKDGGGLVVATKDGAAIKSILLIPVCVTGKLKWVLSFDSSQSHAFDEIDEFVAEYIHQELPIIYRMYELYQKTLMLSRYDGLTGLMNRRYFEHVFEEKLNRAIYSKTQLVVMLFDLDGLKRVNDNYGHHAGDAYIKAFVQLLTEAFAGVDMLARIGGDEFTGIFEKADIALLVHQIETLRQAFDKQQIQSGDIVFSGSFSYGIASYPMDSKDLHELQMIADQKMYRDKQSRRKGTSS